jgi:hypothetical protein
MKNEFLNNDLPDNNNSIVALGDDNLLIPTSDQVYNPNDKNRLDNNLSHQETNLLNNNLNIDSVNTSIDIPLVYSIDEITDTTIIHKYTPSYTRKIIDTGSGDLGGPDEINNNSLNNFKSIE